MSKRLIVMNGWKWCLRHCWWRYLVKPFRWDFGAWDRPGGWASFQVLGFAIFWMKA